MMPEDIIIELDEAMYARFEAFAKTNGRTAEEQARFELTRAADEYAKQHPDD